MLSGLSITDTTALYRDVSIFCVFNKKSWGVIGINFRIYNQRSHMTVGSNPDTNSTKEIEVTNFCLILSL